jgi:prefoldin subunit 5
VTFTPADELRELEEYAKDLEQELESVKARISELKGTKA